MIPTQNDKSPKSLEAPVASAKVFMQNYEALRDAEAKATDWLGAFWSAVQVDLKTTTPKWLPWTVKPFTNAVLGVEISTPEGAPKLLVLDRRQTSCLTMGGTPWTNDGADKITITATMSNFDTRKDAEKKLGDAVDIYSKIATALPALASPRVAVTSTTTGDLWGEYFEVSTFDQADVTRLCDRIRAILDVEFRLLFEPIFPASRPM